jgi:hypothetical protein
MSTVLVIIAIIAAALVAAVVVLALALCRSAARDDAMLARSRPPHPEREGNDG